MFKLKRLTGLTTTFLVDTFVIGIAHTCGTCGDEFKSRVWFDSETQMMTWNLIQRLKWRTEISSSLDSASYRIFIFRFHVLTPNTSRLICSQVQSSRKEKMIFFFLQLLHILWIHSFPSLIPNHRDFGALTTHVGHRLHFWCQTWQPTWITRTESGRGWSTKKEGGSDAAYFKHISSTHTLFFWGKARTRTLHSSYTRSSINEEHRKTET